MGDNHSLTPGRYALTAGSADRFLPAVVASPAGSAGAGRAGLERTPAGFAASVGSGAGLVCGAGRVEGGLTCGAGLVVVGLG